MIAQALYLIAAVLTLGAYGALMRGYVRATSWRYLTANLAAGALGLVSALLLGVWGAALLNGVWALLALVALLRGMR